jgi:hypothetical protein
MRRKNVQDEGRPNSRNFVGRYARPHAASAQGDSPIHGPPGNGLGHGSDKIRIIIRGVHLMGSKIHNLVTRSPQCLSHGRLQRKPPMIGRNPNAHELCPFKRFFTAEGAKTAEIDYVKSFQIPPTPLC